MEEMLALAAKARELQAPASAPAPAAPAVAETEARSERRASVPWWRWLFSPSFGFGLGAAAAALLLYLGMVRPLQVQQAKSDAEAADLQIRFAQMTRLKQTTGEQAAETEKKLTALQKEKDDLLKKAVQSQMRIAALETKIAQSTRPADDDLMALEALRQAAQTTERAMGDLTETLRVRGGPGPEKAAFRLLNPVASALLNPRVTFLWEPDDKATDYTVVILDSDLKQVAKSPLLKETEWSTILPRARGQNALSYYEWTVIAQRDGQEIGRSIPAKFAVLDVEKLAAEVKAKRGRKP
jgi:hypothetical protein